MACCSVGAYGRKLLSDGVGPARWTRVFSVSHRAVDEHGVRQHKWALVHNAFVLMQCCAL